MNCKHCGRENPPGSLYCSECFLPLPATSPTPAPAHAAPRSVASAPATAAGPRLEVLDQARPTGQWVELPAPPWEPALLLGRDDLSSGVVVDINLDEFKGHTRGVSRKHARLLHRDGQYYLRDWESTHGTWHNKHKLGPDEELPLDNLDEIRLARLVMRFRLPEERTTP